MNTAHASSRVPARRMVALLAACCVALCGVTSASAQSMRDTATVQADAARGVSGRIAINQAAGTGNAQVNLAAIATSQGDAQWLLHAGQQVDGFANRQRDAQASIASGAFAAGNGALAINQAAGAGNRQINLLAIGQGATQLAAADDQALAGVSGEGPGTEGAVSVQGTRVAHIDPDAFHGSQGVLQVNQTAGVGNQSTNAIVLQLPGGTH